MTFFCALLAYMELASLRLAMEVSVIKQVVRKKKRMRGKSTKSGCWETTQRASISIVFTPTPRPALGFIAAHTTLQGRKGKKTDSSGVWRKEKNIYCLQPYRHGTPTMRPYCVTTRLHTRAMIMYVTEHCISAAQNHIYTWARCFWTFSMQYDLSCISLSWIQYRLHAHSLFFLEKRDSWW